MSIATAVPLVAQNYQAVGQEQQQQPTAASALTFNLLDQQTSISSAGSTQQQAQSAFHQPAHSCPPAVATASCQFAHAPSTSQQAQVPVKQHSQQPAQSSSTPAFYNQQISIPQEQPLPQNTQSSVQQILNQLNHDSVNTTLQQMVQHPTLSSHSLQCPTQQQVGGPTLQQHGQKVTTMTLSEQRLNISQSQLHPTRTPFVQVAAEHQSYFVPGLPDADPQSYAQSAVQQAASGPGQYQSVQCIPTPHSYGGANRAVSPHNFPTSSQQNHTVQNNQQVSFQRYNLNACYEEMVTLILQFCVFCTCILFVNF